MRTPCPSSSGFTLVELMIVVALLTVLIASTYHTFMTGHSLWDRVDHSVELEGHLREAFDRLVPEVAMSGHDKKGSFQITIGDNGGFNGSDILRFSIPVICQSNGNPVDPEGNAAHWGAPLTWGCTDASCMDRDQNCDTVEYKYIEYAVNAQNSLVRRVLDYSQNLVREDVVGPNIADLQVESNFNQRVLSITLTAKIEAKDKAQAAATTKRDVYLRNAR